MSWSSSTRTSRSVQITTGPDGTRTEVTTITGPDGTRTETRVIGGSGGGGGGSRGFSSHFGGGGGGFTKKSSPTISSRYKSGWGGRKEKKPSGPPMQLEGKTYTEIRDQCLREGRLFEDPDFPAVDASIFYSRTPPRPFEWKRPSEIVSNPQLFVDGASRFDVQQGELGDCWLLAAVASLCQYKDLLYRVVPKDQSFTDKYAGIFHFQFWQYGKWTDIIVDDRLPTYYDKLVFMHSKDHNEFWTPLLEKAYAKLVGSYEALKGGATSEAMEDFTGGVTEMFDFRQGVHPSLFNIMLKAYERSSMMGCSIEAVPGRTEAELTNGLICGHAYSITRVAKMNIKTSRTSGQIPMVRIRNPWGNECEWKGAWSDKSPEWKFISDSERAELGLTFDDDGEFWMSFQDFTSNFQKLEICNLGPDTFEEPGTKKRWEATNQDGAWRKRVNAGGCRNYLDTFWTNPQYRVNVVDADDDDDDDAGTVLIGLMQKGRRQMRKEGQDLMTIGYVIYRVPDRLKDPNAGPLDMRFFKTNASVAKSPSFINMREVCGRHKLPPGHYAIVPSTFEPNQPGEYLIRIFSEKPAPAGEVDEETGMTDVQVVIDRDGRKRPVAEVTEDDKRQDEDLRAAFKKVSGEDMEIDAYELQDILNAAFMKEFKFDGFTPDTCRSMVAMMDLDRSGKLGYEEFKKLWNDLRLWKGVFKQYDKDRSGTFNSYELRQAFHSCGFRLSNSTFNALVQRYSHRDGKIYFDDMIHCIVRLKTMFETFKDQDDFKTGEARFSLDEFIQVTMYS